MSITVIVHFEAKAERHTEFANLMQTVCKELPQVHGCLGVSVYRQANSDTRYTLVEQWQSIERHKAHVADLQSSGEWQTLSEHLAGEPVSDYFSSL